jgi:hypothetical protein
MKKTLSKMKLNRETLQQLDTAGLPGIIAGGQELDTDKQCRPFTDTCNVSCYITG